MASGYRVGCRTCHPQSGAELDAIPSNLSKPILDQTPLVTGRPGLFSRKTSLLPPPRSSRKLGGDGPPRHPPCATQPVTSGNYLLTHCPAHSQHSELGQPGSGGGAGGGEQLSADAGWRDPGSWRHRRMAGSPAWSGTAAITPCLCGHSWWLL